MLLLFVGLAFVTVVLAVVVAGNADDGLVLRSGAENCCGIEKIDFVGVVVVGGRLFVIVDCVVDDAGTVPVTPNRNDGAADVIVGGGFAVLVGLKNGGCELTIGALTFGMRTGIAGCGGIFGGI